MLISNVIIIRHTFYHYDDGECLSWYGLDEVNTNTDAPLNAETNNICNDTDWLLCNLLCAL